MLLAFFWSILHFCSKKIDDFRIGLEKIQGKLFQAKLHFGEHKDSVARETTAMYYVYVNQRHYQRPLNQARDSNESGPLCTMKPKLF